MWKSIDGDIAGSKPERVVRNIDAEDHSGSMLRKFFMVFSSAKSPMPIWKPLGASLQRAAQHGGEDSLGAVKPIKQTFSQFILLFANASHALAPHVHALARSPRSAVAPENALGKDVHAMASQTSNLSDFPDAGEAPARPVPEVETSFFDRNANHLLNNVHAIGMLQKRGYAFSENEHASVAAQLLKAAVDMLVKDSESEPAFARKVMRDLAYFGGLNHEPVSRSYQSNVMRGWLAEMIFDSNIEDFIVNSLAATEGPSDFTTARLRQCIHSQIDDNIVAVDTAHSSYEKDAVIKDWIWRNVILETLPMLRFSPSGAAESLVLNDAEWGKMHAGLQLAKHVGIDVSTVSEEEAADLGKLMLAALEERAVPLEWGRFFQLPARCHRVMSGSWEDAQPAHGELAETLQAYFGFCDQILEDNSPISKFQRLMAVFQTRPQLAQKLRERDCPEVALNTLLNFGEITCWSTPKLPQYRLKNLYQTQVDDIAAAYTALDKLAMIVALGSLPDDQIEFIRHAEIQKMRVTFSSAHHFQSRITRIGSVLPPERLTVELKDSVDVFAVRQFGQERLYALEKCDEQYSLKRVQRRPEDFYTLMHSKQPGQDADYRFAIHGEGAPWRREEWTLDVLCEEIAQQHGKKFSKALFDLGFEKTTLERIGDVGLSFLPGYTCISELQQGNQGPAGLACSIDALSLFSVAGKLSSMSVKAGQAFYQGGLTAVRQATNEMAARGTLQAALRTGGNEFMRYGLQPASKVLGRQELQSLGIAVARALDPGVELLGRTSLQAVRQLSDLGSRVQRFLPNLHRTLRKIDPAQGEPLVAAGSAVHSTGRLPGMEREIAIVGIEEKTIKGDALYVQIDPLSGQMFGPKYKRTEDGVLKLTGIGVYQRLQRLRKYGLSGRGAAQAGTSYASSRSVKTVELPSAVRNPGGTFSLDVSNVEVLERLSNLDKEAIAASGGLAGLAKKNDVDLKWLAPHLKDDGGFTSKGNDLVRGYHVSKWMALSNKERLLKRGSGFAAAIHILDYQWRRLVNIRGELRPAGYDLMVRLETGTSFPSPTKEQIEQWINMPVQERRRMGLIRFALERSISASAFERGVKRYRGASADAAEAVAENLPGGSQPVQARSPDAAEEVHSGVSRLDINFYHGAPIFEAPPAFPAVPIDVGNAPALRSASADATLGSELSVPNSEVPLGAASSGAATGGAPLIFRPWENLPADRPVGGRRSSGSPESRLSGRSSAHEASAYDDVVASP